MSVITKRNQWINKKSRISYKINKSLKFPKIIVFRSNKNISIQVSNLQIAQSEKTIELNFRQEFNSKKYSDVGIKELVWTKTGNDWKILKETWIPS